jgi:hypothetical protein
MSQRYSFEYITLDPRRSFQENLISGPGNAALPTLTNGSLAKFYHVFAYDGDDANVIFIRFTETASDGDSTVDFPLPVIGKSSWIFDCHGYAFIGWDESGDTGSRLTVTPLADF